MKMIKILFTVIIVLTIAGVGVLAYQKKNQKSQQTNQETTQQRDIVEIKKFSGVQDATVEFVSASKSSYSSDVPTSIYYLGSDQYELDARTGKIIQFSSRDLPVGSENEKKYDNTSNYTQEELEAKSRQLITDKAPDVNLEQLTPNHGNKDKNYFFRWEDRSMETTEGYAFVQVGFTQGGVLLNYINAL